MVTGGEILLRVVGDFLVEPRIYDVDQRHNGERVALLVVEVLIVNGGIRDGADN